MGTDIVVSVHWTVLDRTTHYTYGRLSAMQSPDAVAEAVGRNVRALRQQRRMTIDALAAAAGVSRGTVIQIETARGNPSIGTLVALAVALRVGVASLVDGDAEPRVVIRRDAEAARLWSSAAGSSAVFRIGTDPPDVVELWDWTLQPGDGFDGEAHPMGTQEVLSVLSGRLDLHVGATNQQLDAGDTVMFQAHAPHRYGGIGDVPVRFVMVVLQPGDAGLVPPTSIAEAEAPPR
jgi:transcriptional regulator with XRE-family HTH domain